MFYEMRTYTLHIGKMKQYLEHFEKEGLPVISRYAKLVVHRDRRTEPGGAHLGLREP
ncbi:MULTISPECIES: NIPSNAP family protein [Pseudomonas]|uniref:NIPSNAP family protein n=1 Tax=Pseudomonas TaxID=286 RepID=UPI002235E730|nr:MULTISPECIES: NIPSNAP family protein [Pseudomonas]